MIEARELRKEYGDFVAVEGSTFSVDDGEVFGIVGPNGAGKTTTLKMLAGLLDPTAGSATVAGFDAGETEMRRHLGFLPEESPLYEEMTAITYLQFFADLYDVDPADAERRIHETLSELELDHRDRQIGDMSKGMKRKVAIARSLINDPDVLIYDEPASGLDPLTTNYIIEFTARLAEEGKMIVFSAHNLFHVESICDRVAIMRDGAIVARGDLDTLQAEHGETTYHVYTTRGARQRPRERPLPDRRREHERRRGDPNRRTGSRRRGRRHPHGGVEPRRGVPERRRVGHRETLHVGGFVVLAAGLAAFARFHVTSVDAERL